jgi:hypothetical protein
MLPWELPMAGPNALYQLLRTGSQQLRQWIGNRVSICQLNNIILTHSGVSTMVILMSRNNKSTRYGSLFQLLKHQVQL